MSFNESCASEVQRVIESGSRAIGLEEMSRTWRFWQILNSSGRSDISESKINFKDQILK